MVLKLKTCPVCKQEVEIWHNAIYCNDCKKTMYIKEDKNCPICGKRSSSYKNSRFCENCKTEAKRIANLEKITIESAQRKMKGITKQQTNSISGRNQAASDFK